MGLGNRKRWAVDFCRVAGAVRKAISSAGNAGGVGDRASASGHIYDYG